MTELKTTTNDSWSSGQSIALALFALLLGISGGWLIRRSLAARPTEAPQVASPFGPNRVPDEAARTDFRTAPAMPSPEELRKAADSQAAPLVEQLKADPTNAALLAQVGNLYYDAKQYPVAIEYYERSLKSSPKDASVRTDLGTAYWYKGDADTAIGEFQRALADEPDQANALFNLGIVKWNGKHDAAGAIADWKKLLATNPSFPARAKVEDLIAQAQNSLDKRP